MSEAAAEPAVYNLLVVDDDSTIRYNVKEYLTKYHKAPYKFVIDEAATAERAVERLDEKSYDLIICDINLPDTDRDGFDVIAEAKAKYPAIKTALITAYELDKYMTIVKERKVYNIITKTAPFNFQELGRVVNNLLIPESAFGLDKYLTPETPLKEIVITSSLQITDVQLELGQFFDSLQLPDGPALTIAMIEAITNAVYHSAVNPDGSTKYTKGEVIEQLPPECYVTVSYGRDDTTMGVSITDQGGSVDAEKIIYWMERNVTGENLMDTHGRGWFLMHKLIDRVIINLWKGKRTELILLHFITDEPFIENKPLYINEV